MKKIIRLSKRNVHSMKELRDLFVKKLKLPDYCGTSLDALHDCLSETGNAFLIKIKESDELKDALEGRYTGLIQMLTDTCNEQPDIKKFIIK